MIAFALFSVGIWGEEISGWIGHLTCWYQKRLKTAKHVYKRESSANDTGLQEDRMAYTLKWMEKKKKRKKKEWASNSPSTVFIVIQQTDGFLDFF